MRVTASVNVAPVGTYYAQLATMLRQDLPKTLRMEAAATVRRAMQMQKHSSVAVARRNGINKGIARFYDGGGIGGSVNVTGRGRWGKGVMWARDLRGDTARFIPIGYWNGKLTPLADHQGKLFGRWPNPGGWHMPDADWMKVKQAWKRQIEFTKKNVAARLAARGLTAKSYLEILEKLNAGAISVPSFVQRAKPISGKSRAVGFAQTFGERSSQPMVEVSNTSGVAIATGGQRKLNAAIAIRRAFFMRAMSEGFFFDAKFVARNYPWAKVS